MQRDRAWLSVELRCGGDRLRVSAEPIFQGQINTDAIRHYPPLSICRLWPAALVLARSTH